MSTALEKAKKIYELFRTKEGYERMSGMTSLVKIIEICEQDKPQRVLEMGAGIGTITRAILESCDAMVDTYESNQWCLGQLRNNAASQRLSIIETYRLLPPSTEYDLLVVDGGTGKSGDTDDGKTRTIYLFLKYLDRIGKIYVEGNRTGQRAFIRRALKDKYIFRPIRFAPSDRETPAKGGTVYLLKPSRSKIRWLNWLFWEIIDRIRK